MMAGYNVAQETLTGELSALGPNTSVASAAAEHVDRSLEAVTPELAEQVNMEAAALSGWLQFKTKNYLIREIFSSANQSEQANESGEVNIIDPIDSLLSSEFAVNLITVRDEAVLPELQHQQNTHLESAADIVGAQLPRLRERHEHAVATHYLFEADNLAQDIENCQMRVNVHKGMLSYIKRLATDADPHGELMEMVDKVAHDAKLDVYREIIELLAERAAGLDVDSEEFMVLQRKVLALEAERQAMVAVQETLILQPESVVKPNDTEVAEMPESFEVPEEVVRSVIELQPIREQKPALIRVMGSISIGGAFAKRIFVR